LNALKSAGKLSAYLAPAILVAGTAIANEPDMARAASIWKSGIAARLDGGSKQLISQLTAASKVGWIAGDQQELERFLWHFQRELEALRSVLGDIAGMIDEVAAGYRSYWLHLGELAITTIALLSFSKKLQLLPQTKFWGWLLEKFIATAAYGVVATLTWGLGALLKDAVVIMSTMIKKGHQFNYILPAGAAKVDFTQVVLDAGRYPSFQEPPPGPNTLPQGYQGFDWIAPRVDKPAP
jgi:hypothetical protein